MAQALMVPPPDRLPAARMPRRVPLPPHGHPPGAMESGVCLYVSFVTVSVGIAPVASAPGVHGPRTADLQLSATSYGHAML